MAFKRVFLNGVLPIAKNSISIEIVAGVTLAALAIPEVMGYTKIAGMPVITGLYTILLPIIIFALIGSSRHLVVGADSATAAIMFAGLLALAQPYSSEWVALAGWLAILVAGFMIIASIFKLGFLADFMSRTVLIGFLTGVGIQVACGQFAGMFGVEKTGRGPIMQAINAFKDLPNASAATIAVSAGVLVVILGSRLINKKIPGALIAVIGAIALSAWLDLSAQGVSILGTVPSGLPSLIIPAIPTATQWATLVPIAGSLALVILAQSAATSRAYAVKYDDKGFEEDQDLVGIGGANLGAALTGTFPVNGSPTKTQMVDSAGGRSQLAQLTTAALVVIVLLFLTKPLSYMPNAVLSAVVFLIGVELVDFKGMKSIYDTRKAEFWVAMVTVVTVVVAGVEQGILLAIALSLIVHVRHSYKPSNALIAYKDGKITTLPVTTRTQSVPGLMIYLFGANLYYANAESFQDEVIKLTKRPKTKIKWFAIDAIAVGDIDYTAAEVLRKVVNSLKAKGIRVVLVNAERHVKEELEASGIYEIIGAENIYPNIHDMVADYNREQRENGTS